MKSRMKIDILAALKAKNPATLKKLIAAGAIMSEEIDDGCTPIQWAAKNKHWECVEAIVEAMGKTDENDSELNSARFGAALAFAVQSNQLKTAKILLEANANLNWYLGNNNNILHLAVINQNNEMLTLLLTHKACLIYHNKENRTPIELAAINKSWSCVETIAKNHKTSKSNDLARYGQALLYAVVDNRYDTADLLLQAGAPTNIIDINTRNSCLHWVRPRQNVGKT